MACDGSSHLSCASHCCLKHGCKYGYDCCPVATGEIVQEYDCPYCPKPESVQEIKDTITAAINEGYRLYGAFTEGSGIVDLIYQRLDEAGAINVETWEY